MRELHEKGYEWGFKRECDEKLRERDQRGRDAENGDKQEKDRVR